MGISVDSSALDLVASSLDLTGGATESVLEDERIIQTLDVGSLARRGLVLGPDGIFYGILQNTHAAAGSLSVAVNPYSPGVDAARNQWPGVVPQRFDVWVISAHLVGEVGTGNPVLDEGLLRIVTTSAHEAWGEDDGGGNPLVAPREYLARWDSISLANTGAFVGLTESGDPMVKINRRLRRGELLALDTDMSTGTAVIYQCIITLGMFPRGLGQDAST